jgi:uncharacterized membrane protein
MKTQMKTVLPTATLVLASLASPPALAYQASFKVLDSSPQTTEKFCGATSISDNGRVIGGYSRSEQTASGRAASLWRGNIAAQRLTTFATDNLWGHVRALSPTGTLAVGSATLGNEEQPFLWTPSTGVNSLIVPPAYSGGEAMGVTADGRFVVGHANYVGSLYNRPIQLTEAMLWVDGQPSALGFIGNGAWSKAYDVSADGRVVVGEAHLNTSIGEYMAVIWLNGNGPIQLGDLPGGYDRSRGVAISADGNTVAGWGSKQLHPFLHRMFRWTRTGGMQDLGIAQGHILAEATAMSRDGNVIVGWGQLPNSTNRTPVIWDAANGVREIVPILEAAGLDLSAWRNSYGHVFMQPTGIAADGKTIVGFGNLNNDRRAWIATLP